jgi:SAM-dependent methyltransferase
VDVIVLPHVLEVSPDPHQVLREAERALIAEGHVVILGFNPWSLWGLIRLFLAWRANPPWNGRFLRLGRLKDWLGVLGFEIIETRRFLFRPPLRRERLARRVAFIEKLGSYFWPLFGAAYIAVGRKRLVNLIPIKTQWRGRKRLIAGGVVEPTTRTPTSK